MPMPGATHVLERERAPSSNLANFVISGVFQNKNKKVHEREREREGERERETRRERESKLGATSWGVMVPRPYL